MTIPGFYEHFDFKDLLRVVAPRELLIVSATQDKYSEDAEDVYRSSLSAYEELEDVHNLQHQKFHGGHALNEERFNYIVRWIAGHNV